MNCTITLDLADTIGVIRPELHGHFLEHLGSAVYGGIWVGEDSPAADREGFRAQAIEYLRQLRIPVLRWPGGCFADDYHWRDGIGPRTGRPRTINRWWGGEEETNAFGTHEFMTLCRLLGTRPYLAGNVGSGSPAELRGWVEYCNYPFGSTLADERRANGAPGPFGVRYWGIGNESWGCGGHLNPEEYCTLYSRFATYVPSLGGTDPYLIAVGPEANDLDWTTRFFTSFRTKRKYRPPLHGFAMHFYNWGESTPLAYTRETMQKQMDQFPLLEQAIIDQREAIDTFATDPTIGRVGLIVDEWGTWDRSDPVVEAEHGKLWQQNTMRDALATGLALNVFHRQADKLAMCNLAQLVNVLQAPLLASGGECLRTPTYYALLLGLPHRGGMSLRIHQEGAHVSASASRTDRQLALTLVNPDPERSVAVTVTSNAPGTGAPEGLMLHHPDWNAWNSFDAPETIRPVPVTVRGITGNWTVELPPCSLTTITHPL
jgi:alpha-L-arabinofuranosidase